MIFDTRIAIHIISIQLCKIIFNEGDKSWHLELQTVFNLLFPHANQHILNLQDRQGSLFRATTQMQWTSKMMRDTTSYFHSYTVEVISVHILFTIIRGDITLSDNIRCTLGTTLKNNRFYHQMCPGTERK